MGAPLRVGDEVIGVVVVSSRRPRRFTDEDLELLLLVADRAAPAVERARLLETIRAGREELENLSRRLLAAQEEERRRLAVELHDELGQILTAIKINLESKRRNRRASLRILEDAIASVDQAMDRVRDLALDLRPSVLDDLGLAAALRWYVDRFAREARAETHLSIDAVAKLDPVLEITCFRLAQEVADERGAACAGAATSGSTCTSSAIVLELKVRDDGIGFDAAAARARALGGASLGLLGMEERASLAGGRLEVSQRAGTRHRGEGVASPLARRARHVTPIRVLLADDHTLVRAGIRRLLESIAGVEVVGEAGDGHEALRLAEALRPDVVLLDIGMPGLNGLEVAGHLASFDASIRVLILSMHSSEEYVLRALRAGCAGYLLKGSAVSELEVAVRAVARGETYLSPAVSKQVVADYVAPDGRRQGSARRADAAAARDPSARGRGAHEQGHRAAARPELQDGGRAPRAGHGTARRPRCGRSRAVRGAGRDGDARAVEAHQSSSIGSCVPHPPIHGSFCRGNRVHLDRPGLGVQRACDRHLLCRELFRRLLVAQRVDVLAVVQDVRGVVRPDAGNGALGVGRPHSHLGMTGSGAHVVRDGAGERLLALGCGQRGARHARRLTIRCFMTLCPRMDAL